MLIDEISAICERAAASAIATKCSAVSAGISNAAAGASGSAARAVDSSSSLFIIKTIIYDYCLYNYCGRAVLRRN